MPTKRLALIIRGAVSLGSYEGGVLYELLRALDHHNSSLPTGSDRRVCIDVLAGASAGSMTAAITMQVLLGGRAKLAGARDNPFYQAWVVDVNLAELLRYRNGEYEEGSLLSGDFIAELAQKHLGSAPTGAPHPAKPDSGHLRFAFALSNLRGLDYDTTPDLDFPCTRFQDEWCDEIDLANPAAADWAQIRLAAITSGAFPAAFPVRFLTRARTSYNTNYLSPADWPATEPTRDLPYVDGGVFNNEPLGLAKGLVDLNDQHLDNDNRFYLYVSPSPKLSDRNKDFDSRNVTLLDMGSHLVNAVLGQAQYQDLSALRKTNQKVAAFDATAQTLSAVIASNAGQIASFRATTTLLAGAAFANLPAGAETLAQAVARLGAAYATQPWFPSDPEQRQAWAEMLAAFERTATLQEKDTMTLLTICAEKAELLGDALSAFGGFTAQAVRHYDYEVGRNKTQQWLANPAKNKLGLDLTGYVFEPTNLAGDRAAAVAALLAVAEESGDQLGSRVAFQSKNIMKHFGIGWPIKNMLASGINGFTSAYVTKALDDEAAT